MRLVIKQIKVGTLSMDQGHKILRWHHLLLASDRIHELLALLCFQNFRCLLARSEQGFCQFDRHGLHHTAETWVRQHYWIAGLRAKSLLVAHADLRAMAERWICMLISRDLAQCGKSEKHFGRNHIVCLWNGVRPLLLGISKLDH